jgi:hypothetical protein
MASRARMKGYTASGDDAFFNCCAGGAQGIVEEVFLGLHLHL